MESEEFKKEIEQRYLDNPNICPFCGSSDITADHPDFNDNVAWRDVECRKCKRVWTEEFKLTGITIE